MQKIYSNAHIREFKLVICIITVAYLAVIDSPCEVIGQDDAAKAQWFLLDELPKLAFDHDEIMSDATTLFKRMR